MLDTDPATLDPATPDPTTTTTLMPTLTMARADSPPPDLDSARDNIVSWYKRIFGFTDKVAKALYDKQLLRRKESLAELNDAEVDNVMRAIR